MTPLLRIKRESTAWPSLLLYTLLIKPKHLCNYVMPFPQKSLIKGFLENLGNTDRAISSNLSGVLTTLIKSIGL